jgi:hypothetical protein
MWLSMMGEDWCVLPGTSLPFSKNRAVKIKCGKRGVYSKHLLTQSCGKVLRRTQLRRARHHARLSGTLRYQSLCFQDLKGGTKQNMGVRHQQQLLKSYYGVANAMEQHALCDQKTSMRS